jgi:hypothetical protein
MEEGYRKALNDKEMRLMRGKWHVPKSLKCEKTTEKQKCDMFPCKERTFYRMVESSYIGVTFNNGGGGSGKQMYLCYTCFQIHRNNVKKTKGEKVVYVFEHWRSIKSLS